MVLIGLWRPRRPSMISAIMIGMPISSDAQQIDQHEGAAAVVAGDIGELPDIAQTDRRTRRPPG
jgi:hypothetical protein